MPPFGQTELSAVCCTSITRLISRKNSLESKNAFCRHIYRPTWKSEVCAQHLRAHIAWLEANKNVILIGGSLRQALGQVPKGGLWIAEAQSKSQLEDLLKTDPFYVAGLRQSYEILHWSKANEDCKVLL
jgi:uncharacterized protein YciI